MFTNRKRLSFTISTIIVCILVYFVLGNLNRLKLNAEQAEVNAEIEVLRLHIAENWISNNAASRKSNIKALTNTNPMQLVPTKPSNYLGEFDKTPIKAKSSWFFNKRFKHLTYILSNSKELHFKLMKCENRSLRKGYQVAGLI